MGDACCRDGDGSSVPTAPNAQGIPPVAGRYELPADRVGKTVALKIVDMLGEEVLIPLRQH